MLEHLDFKRCKQPIYYDGKFYNWYALVNKTHQIDYFVNQIGKILDQDKFFKRSTYIGCKINRNILHYIYFHSKDDILKLKLSYVKE